MNAIEKIDTIRRAAAHDGWVINPDHPNSYSFTAAHFDGMGSAVSTYVMSDMQGRVSATISVGGIGIQLNDRLYNMIDTINIFRKERT